MAFPISVIIPTWRRHEQLLATIGKLLALDPAPAEILVHVDANDSESVPAVRAAFPQVTVIQSDKQVGPGGGRNKLMGLAKHPIVASFDDDSYPLDSDFFRRVEWLFEQHPKAAVIACEIIHRNEPMVEAKSLLGRTAHFIGCGVVYRRDEFLATGGYVPLAVAYGMEEVDLAMRLHARGGELYHCPWLRVFHDTLLQHHGSPKINSAQIMNLALLAFLRYPAHLWPYGALQVANRVAWCLRARRFRGIGRGVARIPGHLWSHRSWRAPVTAPLLRSFLKLRNQSGQLEPLALPQGGLR